MKSCTKIVITNSYWLVLMVSVILKMKNLHNSACISAWENEKTLIFFQKMRRQKLYKVSINKFLLENKKSFKRFFHYTIWAEVKLSCMFFILSTTETINTSKQEFIITIFVELFMAHLFKKNSRFYHLPKPRYIRNKKMLHTATMTRKT